jgi:hypothetical protein
LESTDTKVANKAHSHQRTVNTSALSSDELSLIVPSVPHRGESGVPMKCTTRENRANGHPRLSLDGLRVVCNHHSLESERGEEPRSDTKRSQVLLSHSGSTREVVRIGRVRYSPRTGISEEAYKTTAGKCILRTIERNDDKGTLELYESSQPSLPA